MDVEKITNAMKKAEYKYRREKEDPAKRAAYMKAWKAKHPEKQSEYNKRFYLRKAVEYGLVKPEEVEELDSEEFYKAVYQYRKEKGYVEVKEGE